jgi:hypothetical protein
MTRLALSDLHGNPIALEAIRRVTRLETYANL